MAVGVDEGGDRGADGEGGAFGFGEGDMAWVGWGWAGKDGERAGKGGVLMLGVGWRLRGLQLGEL